MSKQSRTLWPIVLVLLSMISVQGSASLAKSLFPILGPIGMTAWRLVFSSIMLALIFRPWQHKISRQALLPIVIYGVVMGCMNLSFYSAIGRIPVGIAVAIELTGPIAVAMFSSRRIWDFVWVILAIIGLAMLLPLHQASADLDPLGILLALAAGSCWALYIIFGRKAGALHGSSSVALGSIIAMLFVFPIGAYTSYETMFNWSVLPLALVVAVLASAFPYALDMIAMPRLPAHTFSTLMSLSPVIASLSGLLILHEMLSTIQWLAIGCIVISSMGTVLSVNRKPASVKRLNPQ